MDVSYINSMLTLCIIFQKYFNFDNSKLHLLDVVVKLSFAAAAGDESSSAILQT